MNRFEFNEHYYNLYQQQKNINNVIEQFIKDVILGMAVKQTGYTPLNDFVEKIIYNDLKDLESFKEENGVLRKHQHNFDQILLTQFNKYETKFKPLNELANDLYKELLSSHLTEKQKDFLNKTELNKQDFLNLISTFYYHLTKNHLFSLFNNKHLISEIKHSKKYGHLFEISNEISVYYFNNKFYSKDNHSHFPQTKLLYSELQYFENFLAKELLEKETIEEKYELLRSILPNVKIVKIMDRKDSFDLELNSKNQELVFDGDNIKYSEALEKLKPEIYMKQFLSFVLKEINDNSLQNDINEELDKTHNVVKNTADLKL